VVARFDILFYHWSVVLLDLAIGPRDFNEIALHMWFIIRICSCNRIGELMAFLHILMVMYPVVDKILVVVDCSYKVLLE